MYLGLDIGTTATKAVLVDEHHAIVATSLVQSVPAHPGNQRVQRSAANCGVSSGDASIDHSSHSYEWFQRILLTSIFNRLTPSSESNRT
jgi:N-methylhydantoinase A/oxoprolinase/acetone carboxylase beta subunit